LKEDYHYDILVDLNGLFNIFLNPLFYGLHDPLSLEDHTPPVTGIAEGSHI